MTALSTRFARAAVALLVIAALPIWFHALTAPTRDDCADPGAFFGAARIGSARMGTLEGHLQRFEGGEGLAHDSAQYRLAVRAVRSFSPSQVYGNPIVFAFDTMLYILPWQTRRLEAGDAVLPVHWVSADVRNMARIEAYAYVQGGAPVWHPIQSGLALAWAQLVGGTRPVTVLVVSGVGNPDEFPAISRDAERWLVDAWQQLETACDF